MTAGPSLGVLRGKNKDGPEGGPCSPRGRWQVGDGQPPTSTVRAAHRLLQGLGVGQTAQALGPGGRAVRRRDREGGAASGPGAWGRCTVHLVQGKIVWAQHPREPRG